MNIPRGISGYFCIGKTYGGFKIEKAAGVLYRVCLGWFAFGFILYDIEQLIGHGAEHIKNYDNLIMAVERKFCLETRHETALRYINEAEERAKIGTVCKQV